MMPLKKETNLSITPRTFFIFIILSVEQTKIVDKNMIFFALNFAG